jgi:hypothetical protein
MFTELAELIRMIREGVGGALEEIGRKEINFALLQRRPKAQ